MFESHGGQTLQSKATGSRVCLIVNFWAPELIEMRTKLTQTSGVVIRNKWEKDRLAVKQLVVAHEMVHTLDLSICYESNDQGMPEWIYILATHTTVASHAHVPGRTRMKISGMLSSGIGASSSH